MTTLRWIGGTATTADWYEHLYHISIPVHAGICETDDLLAIETLIRRGYEVVPEGGDTSPTDVANVLTTDEREAMIADAVKAETATTTNKKTAAASRSKVAATKG